jgi:hypothetical protein
VLEDCCASRSRVIRDEVLDVLRKSPLYPLLRVMPLSDFLRSARRVSRENNGKAIYKRCMVCLTALGYSVIW